MIVPSLLVKNDKVRIIAPSGRLPANSLTNAVETLSSWGLNVEFGEHVYDSHSVFSGTDSHRLIDFQDAIDNPNVKLILCARGGYGLTRYIDQLDLTPLIAYPKWIVGFSDVTAFHLKAVKSNIFSIHGPMGTSFARKGAKQSIEQLYGLIFNGTSIIEIIHPQLKIGTAIGYLVGGNLSLVCDSLGTSTEIDTKDKILILEDVGDYYYRMDRMLNQLARAGKFNNLKGLVIASFSDLVQGKDEFAESINDIILRLTQEAPYPIAIAMPIGHEPANFPFVHGAKYQLEVTSELAKLTLITKL